MNPDGCVSTGNPSLDTILHGGLTAHRLYLVEGHPGTGKTTLALQFLLEGVRLGERGLYVTLSETKAELEAVADSHGWSLEGIEIYELVDPADTLEVDAQYTMFEPAEVELAATVRRVLERVEQLQPSRAVFDSLSEMRLLAQGALRYRRQILALKQHFVGRECTVLMLDDGTSSVEDEQLQSIAHGVLCLEHLLSEYGGERRRLRVMKLRGRQFQGGSHDLQILPGGLRVYPRKPAAVATKNPALEPLRSGNDSLDKLLGQGLDRGTSTLLLGPAGVGKSSCATLYAVSAARRGERAAIFLFDESHDALVRRSEGLGIGVEEHVRRGRIMINQIDPGEVSPGEFANLVADAVRPDQDGSRASVVIIDSLNGYMNAMPHERFLTMQVHELVKYLGTCGVVTFLVVAQHGMLGATMGTPIDTSYLSDSVILFRYFEAAGEIRQAISVVKKRTGGHERTIREFSMKGGRIVVGEPLREFHGVLGGTPTYMGVAGDLLRSDDD